MTTDEELVKLINKYATIKDKPSGKLAISKVVDNHKESFVAPDSDGYVYSNNLNDEDLDVFEDISATFDKDSVFIITTDKQQISNNNKLQEPTIKLWTRRLKLDNLIIPEIKSEEVVIDEPIISAKEKEKNSVLNIKPTTIPVEDEEETDTIIPYELRPVEKLSSDIKGAGELKTNYVPAKTGLVNIGNPADIIAKLETVGCQCSPYNAIQFSLILNVATKLVRSALLEGPPGCGKTFTTKCIAQITGSELMVLSCYPGMNLQDLIEKGSDNEEYGILTRAFIASQTKQVVLLIDEIDKVDEAIDSFFLGPLNDGCIYLDGEEPIHANLDNLFVVFTKNYNRTLDDAFMRRVTPIQMEYLSNELEKRILKPHVLPAIGANIVYISDMMRSADGVYRLDRPPAPDELLRAGNYTAKMLKWGITDFEVIGKSLFTILAKSERDRYVFEQYLRFHPEFADALIPDPRRATKGDIFKKLGRIIIRGVVDDPQAEQRKLAFNIEKVGWQHVGKPDEIVQKLEKVGYQCLPYLAKQIGLFLNVKRDMVKTVLLEGPPGCGKSFLAKSLAKIAGADFLNIQCYKEMDTSVLIERRNEVTIALASAGIKVKKDDLIENGPLAAAFLKSQSQPVVLLVDEIDKVQGHIDTFFLGPIQDGRIWMQSGKAIDCDLDNLMIIFTKNFERTLNDALMRRLHPLKMTYLDSSLERKILSPYCVPKLIDNLVFIADIMRNSEGSFEFDRPPAPEELLTTARYILKLLEWGYDAPEDIGFQVWRQLAKSERDLEVLAHLLRYHPDFDNPDDGDINRISDDIIYGRLGKVLLKGILIEKR